MMSDKTAEAITIPDRVQFVAEDLEFLSVKMRSVVEAMDSPAQKDPHLEGLVAVMDDLVADLEELVVRANRVAGHGGPDQGAPPAGRAGDVAKKKVA
jgi:hypothetical protein